MRRPHEKNMTDAEARQLFQPQRDLSPSDRASDKSDPMIVFAYACLRGEFASLLQHRPSPDEVPSPDDIHRMRIAARRLRVALRLFKDILRGEAAQLAEELC